MKLTVKYKNAIADWLREMVEEVKMMMDSGSLTVKMKECALKLLTHNVSTGKVGPVIESILKLTGKKA